MELRRLYFFVPFCTTSGSFPPRKCFHGRVFFDYIFVRCFFTERTDNSRVANLEGRGQMLSRLHLARMCIVRVHVARNLQRMWSNRGTQRDGKNIVEACLVCLPNNTESGSWPRTRDSSTLDKRYFLLKRKVWFFIQYGLIRFNLCRSIENIRISRRIDIYEYSTEDTSRTNSFFFFNKI